MAARDTIWFAWVWVAVGAATFLVCAGLLGYASFRWAVQKAYDDRTTVSHVLLPHGATLPDICHVCDFRYRIYPTVSASPPRGVVVAPYDPDEWALRTVSNTTRIVARTPLRPLRIGGPAHPCEVTLVHALPLVETSVVTAHIVSSRVPVSLRLRGELSDTTTLPVLNGTAAIRIEDNFTDIPMADVMDVAVSVCHAAAEETEVGVWLEIDHAQFDLPVVDETCIGVPTCGFRSRPNLFFVSVTATEEPSNITVEWHLVWEMDGVVIACWVICGLLCLLSVVCVLVMSVVACNRMHKRAKEVAEYITVPDVTVNQP